MASDKKRRKKRKRRSAAFLVLLMLVGVGIMAYPTAAGIWNALYQRRLISAYDDAVFSAASSADDEDLAYEWEKARAYNNSLWPTPFPEDFTFLKKDDPGPEYMDCLNLSGDGIMGYISIPRINISIPIYHGTDTEAMKKGAGHLEGTSLPVGGENTHCVLAAHRGLPGSALFTDLDLLEEGDRFYLRVLDSTLAYEVDQILVVEPENVSPLVIEEGQDYCTLLTCTPYGVNTERLLVRGHRVDYEEAAAAEAAASGTVVTRSGKELIFLAAVVGAAVLIMAAGGRSGKRNQEKKDPADPRRGAP